MGNLDAALPPALAEAHGLIRSAFMESSTLLGTVLELATAGTDAGGVGQRPDAEDIGNILYEPLISLYEVALPAQDALDAVEVDLLRVAGETCEHEQALNVALAVKVAIVNATGILEPAELTRTEIGREITENWHRLLDRLERIDWIDAPDMLDRMRREIVRAADAHRECAAAMRGLGDESEAVEPSSGASPGSVDADAIASKVAELVATQPPSGKKDQPEEVRLLAIAQEKCKNSEVQAWLAEQYAIRKHGEFRTAQDAYEWLEENFEPCGEDTPSGLRGYELPMNAESWKRQVRAVRNATGTNRNQKRTGRTHGSSIVDESDI